MIQIAVLGFGVVGSGVVEVVDKNADVIERNAGHKVRVKHILDIRDFSNSPYADLFVNDFETIERDADINIVVEVIGGATVAYEYTKRAILAGKSVVTSNKELVARHGYELLKLAEEKGVNYLFEASVGGGVPVIRPIAQCLSANKIGEIYGILNGTTNYILSAMQKSGAELRDALADAQKMGYAEADPTADVEGHDACRKICILSSLAFGRHVYPSEVPAEGIMSVTKDDIYFANELGYRIKLLGRARVLTDHEGKDSVAAYVAPHLIGEDNLLASVNGVMNGIVVRGNAVGDVMFYGPGAGKMPTASAVTADIIDAAKHLHAKKQITWGDGCGTDDPMKLESAWYIRTDAPRNKVEREFGEVMFAKNASGGVIAFKTAVMSGNKLADILSRGITPLSMFRVLSDY